MGLVPSRGRWFGRLGSPAQQPQQSFPVLGLAEGIAGDGQPSKRSEADGAMALEPASDPGPGFKALRGLWCRPGAPGLQLGEKQRQAQGQRPPLPARPTTPKPSGCAAVGRRSGAALAHQIACGSSCPEAKRSAYAVALHWDLNCLLAIKPGKGRPVITPTP